MELTPFQRIYLEEKKKLPENTILLMRMGDFYEVCFSDAHLASYLWNVTVSSRYNVPLCGVEFHGENKYIEILLDHGYNVALAEPRENSGKGNLKYVTTIIKPTDETEKGDN